MKVAVMQPQFVPWVGYWRLLDMVDTFAIYDTTAVSKQSWQTRNRIRLPDGTVNWLSVPIIHGTNQALHEVRIDNSRPWRRKHLGTLQAAYGKATHWETLNSLLEPLYAREWEYLVDLSATLIAAVAALLRIETAIVKTSDLGATRAGRIEKLQDFCQILEATEFVEPASAEYLHGYDEIRPGVPIRWFEYEPPPYDQGGQEWLSHLSILDFLAWCGPDAFRTSIAKNDLTLGSR